MKHHLHTLSTPAADRRALVERYHVLRNSCWPLSLFMVPTVLVLGTRNLCNVFQSLLTLLGVGGGRDE